MADKTDPKVVKRKGGKEPSSNPSTGTDSDDSQQTSSNRQKRKNGDAASTITLKLNRVIFVCGLLMAIFASLLYFATVSYLAEQETHIRIEQLIEENKRITEEERKSKEERTQHMQALVEEANRRLSLLSERLRAAEADSARLTQALEQAHQESKKDREDLQKMLAVEKEIDSEREKLRREDREKEREDRERERQEWKAYIFSQTMQHTAEYDLLKKEADNTLQLYQSCSGQLQQQQQQQVQQQQQPQQTQQSQRQQPTATPPKEGSTEWQGNVTLAFFPDYRGPNGNPYQAILYSHLEKEGKTELLVREEIFKLLDAVHVTTDSHNMANNTLTKHVAQIHWLNHFVCFDKPERARKAIDGGMRFIDEVHEAGWKVVWTIHNIFTHSCPQHRELETYLCQELARRVDAIHVMCEETRDMALPHYALPMEKLHVIPHSSYVGLYPDTVTQDQARKALSLDLKPETVVLLFFGLIRHYKGLEDLLEAYDRVLASTPNPETDYLLIVAGEPFMTEYTPEEFNNSIVARTIDRPNLRYRYGVIPDDEVQYFFKAADVVVLPYRTILNSGSLFMAFTFGRPVIGPDTGCVGPYLTDDVAIRFEPGNVDSLTSALRQAGRLKTLESRTAAYKKALAYTPTNMATDFAKMIKSL